MIHIGAGGLVVLVLIATGVFASCGGGGGSDAPSKQEFARNADKVCLDVERRVAALNRARPRSVPDLMRFIEQLKAAVKDGINRLQALERPEGNAGKTAQRFTEALDSEFEEQVLPALNQVKRAVASRDKKALRAASEKLRRAQDQVSDGLARELGAARCAAS